MAKKGMVWVPGHRWKNGKATWHPGYYRKKRPKSKKRIIGNKPVKLYPVSDAYGRRMGWSTKKGRR